jgi:hypothetical protein
MHGTRQFLRIMPSMSSDVELQRAYYDRTARDYDSSHVFSDVEHDIAFHILAGWLPRVGA